MKSPRVAWALVAVLLVGILLFAYSRAQNTQKNAHPHSVTLHWVPTPGAASYNVYRGTTHGGPYVKIGVALNPTYIDTPVPSGAVFYYVVTTVQNNTDKESSYSTEIKASVP